ncbi:Asp-tRNA(Asn)/Glu-tRNA(Gln) amidotransferase subunit GatB [Candidatus Peregrinibacteria bacterium]|jgi:aspartyl-tRNA(Asn)/glutamyl-tRNA(Gln) amidotransferase subunit B|nr:Asp-tRNA(Asn)/Glu-tRNA(Gln) amidotransferase subunit GatB [Candidatus Peregrinibacteria bacterium]MBT4056424.1 Asp-tRNA(Asn)/Glu-tRNA(Gln) amidotransferase subunit GatB [Candidatus Peregrinibacteria bacterium]
MAELEVVVGLEIHAQISTKTKMFCRCDNDSWDKVANVNVCPVCMGFPGQLPVLNEEALRKGIVAALALNCEIREFSKFDRKNYFYPDSPKGFQISQFDEPLSENGELEIGGKKIRITRLHLEDDAGKLTHVRDGSLVDFNRAGTPLMEIVSEPDIRSADEAEEYARVVQQILRYVGASEADMEKGMMRFDASVSIREKGSKTLNARGEIKNLNSFRALNKAIEAEVERQTVLWDAGNPQEEDFTIGWNDEKQEVYVMRSKEGSSDYRYFPEPDIPPVVLTKKEIEKLRSEIPELPAVRRERFVSEYKLSDGDARLLTVDRALADYYEKVVRICGDARLANSFVTTILMKHLKEELIDVGEQKVTAEMMGELLKLVVSGEISNNVAKGEVFEEMYESGKSAGEIVKKKGLKQISDTSELEAVCKKAIEANPQAVEDFKNGKDRAIGSIVGMVMKETKGQANPAKASEIVRKML